MKRIKQSTVVLILLFALFTFTPANEPLPPPYFVYNVSGKVLCDSISDKSDFTVMLYGNVINYDNQFFPISGMGIEHEISIALTDSLGNFSLSAANPFELDSIKAVIIVRGADYIFGNAAAVDKSRYSKLEFFYNAENSSGCSSCSTEPAVKRLRNYNYSTSNLIIDYCN